VAGWALAGKAENGALGCTDKGICLAMAEMAGADSKYNGESDGKRDGAAWLYQVHITMAFPSGGT
jgi:hypothetical protein